jgi:hypothetical protein
MVPGKEGAVLDDVTSERSIPAKPVSSETFFIAFIAAAAAAARCKLDVMVVSVLAFLSTVGLGGGQAFPELQDRNRSRPATKQRESAHISFSFLLYYPNVS